MTDVVVTTRSGVVRGTSDGGVAVFRGVPFAAAPVGELRFLPPRPIEPWSGVLDCTSAASICPQVQMQPSGPLAPIFVNDEPTSEDCLRLNVWTPAADDARRPVMVWIHGGAFTGGSGSNPSFDGSSFAGDGIVYVSINYRLHALGFLYLDEDFKGASGSGNAGLLDQVAALRWVKDNIAGFGGDPDNVTIFGESAGGMSVGTLLGTPAAAGLFRRAIAQSGAASHNLPRAVARRVTHRVLQRLEVAPGDWGALRAVPAERVVEVAAALSYGEAEALLGDVARVGMVFLPVVDGTTLPRSPLELVQDGASRDVDVLVGTTADESRLFVHAMPEHLQKYVQVPAPSKYFAAVGRSDDEVRKVYTGGLAEEATDVDLAIWTDGMFTIPALRLAEAQLRSSDRVWVYRLSWRTPVLGGALGACHGLDLAFVFNRPDWTPFLGDVPPTELMQAVHGAWVQFATMGDPGWPRYDLTRRAVMDFDEPSSIVDDPGAELRALWEGTWT